MRLRRTATLLALATTAMTFLGANVSQAAPETTSVVTDGGRTAEGAEPAKAFAIQANAPITRSQVKTRAYSWLQARVPYSQTAYYSNQYG